MTLVEFVIRGFAAFYLAVAFVEILEGFKDFLLERVPVSKLRRLWKIIDRKPFNCEFCMCFWWAIPLSLPYFDPRVMFGIAGMGAILVYLKIRLEMLVV